VRARLVVDGWLLIYGSGRGPGGGGGQGTERGGVRERRNGLEAEGSNTERQKERNEV
jgi:hypothetical protein